MRVSIDDQILKDIADEIRDKNGESTLYSPGEMPEKIHDLDTEPDLQEKEVEITSNRATTITPDTGYDGLSSVTVVTSVIPRMQNKTQSIVANGQTVIGADPGYTGLSTVELNVNVPSNVQTKTTTITTNGTTTITPDTGYDGISSLDITTNVQPDMSVYYTSTISGASNAGEIGVLNTIISLPNFTVQGTNFSRVFYNCLNLEEIPSLDTSNTTSMSETFYNCKKITSLPLLNTSNVTNMNSCFYGCSSLVTLPQLDTSNVTNFQFAFSQCTNLTTIPTLSFASATNLTRPFQGTNNLTDDSLNNILAMCIGATSYTGTKTLNALGFYSSSYSSSRIQALSNYQAFLDAGWTIGY